MTNNSLFLQRLLKPVFRLFFRTFTRIRLVGLEHLPPTPPYILFSNHISWFDPLIIGAFSPEPIHIMAMDALFKVWPLGYLMRLVGAFPVKRASLDRRAIESALKILAGGGVVFIFPEGGIARLMKGEKLRRGISFIAQIANVPLVPMGLSGCREIYRLWKLPLRRTIITLTIGRPFLVSSIHPVPGKKMREKSMERIEREMRMLAQEGLALSP